MKKLSFVFLISMFLLVGCGEKKVTCKMAADGEISHYDLEVVGTVKGDKVKKVEATMTFENNEYAGEYCKIINLLKSTLGELKYECKDNKITYKNYDLIVKNGTDKNLINLSKDEFTKYFKDNGMTCEE